jgi:uncharacterized protein YebE (UPF0316 family)
MTNIIIAFFIAQLVNVVLNTLKSVITIKGGRTWASIANAIAYGFNTVVIKSLVQVELETALIITVITNLVGVQIGLLLIEKARKDQLWKITVTVPVQELQPFEKDLLQNDISFITYETKWDKYKVVDIFSKQKADSKTVKEIFKHYQVKYTISANSAML